MKPLIIANWKCNPTSLKEAEKLFDKVIKNVGNVQNVEIVICPPFPYLFNLRSNNLNLKLGAQDCFWQERGAFTGEVSPKMLKDLGVEYVILGHSERRKNLGETDEMINKKIKAALESGLKVILCVGEKGEERKQGKTKEILKSQLQKDLDGFRNWKWEIGNLIVTYEPVWAISTTEGGRAATPEDAKEAASYIKDILNGLIGEEGALKIKIIYGGSVDSQNINSFIKAGVGGALVGAASLKAEEFINLVKRAV